MMELTIQQFFDRMAKPRYRILWQRIEGCYLNGCGGNKARIEFLHSFLEPVNLAALEEAEKFEETPMGYKRIQN